MKSEDLGLIKVSFRLNSALIDDLKDLCKRRGLSLSEAIRTFLHPAVKTELEKDYTLEVAKLKIAERELIDAERAQEVEAKRLKIKREKLETQQVQNRMNPHVFG